VSNLVMPEELPVPQEDDVPVAAHVYRDGEILLTIIIDRMTDDEGIQWYTAYPEGRRNNALVQRRSMDEVRNLMDYYLEGFAQAYDETRDILEDNPREPCIRHRYLDSQSRRCYRCGYRPTPGEMHRRDRAHVKRTGKS
jgi:hypothetical protein